jgi:restriction endonuclease S subunit
MVVDDNWKIVKLGDICEVKKGTSITKNRVVEGGIPVIAGGQQPAYYHNVANRNGKTITISASGAYAGFVNYFEIPIFASDCTTIQSLDESKVLTKYIYLFLKSKQKYIYTLQRGAGQPHVYAKDLVKIDVPLPPLPVQKRIVSILEKAEKLKERRKKANEETNKIIQSVFYEMFWGKKYPMRSLIELSKEKPQYGSGAKAIKYDGKLRYIRITDIDSSGELIKSNPVSPSFFNEKYVLKKGDLLFARSGATVGKTYLHRKNDNSSIYAGYMIRFRFKEEVNPEYVYAFTKTSYYKGWIKKTQTQVAQPNINAKQYGSLKNPLPPIHLQLKFAEIVKKIEAMKERQKKSTEDINQLFDALMQKAFKGELEE